MHQDSVTICAPVHQPGSAITIIRVSGPRSIEVCDSIFTARRRGRLQREKGYTLVHGDIVVGDEIIDEVLVSIFRAPHSYTGEDMVEIACHGSFYIQNTVMALLIDNGASPARAGDFTRRAFLNGKLDLLQAEAVADLIAADSKAAHRLAISQLKGGFSAEIEMLRKELLQLVSLIELELDFGEEDVEFADRSQLVAIVRKVLKYSDSLAASFRAGNALKNGIPVAITGGPNVGKSTLLNGLLKEEKAIVSDIPGTTRDAIEDTFIIDGVLYRFIDTAGMRHTDDIVERLGIERTRKKISGASVVILVTEATREADEINRERSYFIRTLVPEGVPVILVVNKTDLAGIRQLERLRKGIVSGGGSMVFMSAADPDDYGELRKAVSSSSAPLTGSAGAGIVVTNARHYEALIKVSEAMARVLDGMESGISTDLIAIDTRHAIHYLGEICGIISTEEILGNIFRNFCIGK